jgi:serine/threonine-protein kinase
MFNRFEIQSELSKSETATIYKALDKTTNQVVALKTQSLEPLGDHAAAFVENLIAEGENSRDLASQNIAALYGAGEIDGQFCAAMEYIQGNSIATMLARKEAFSIWDLLDITRQVCAGLEHAASKGVAHCSLEPAKIMVQWDGMVKILGYGISTMSLIGAESGKGLGRLTPYCSPEQIRGEAIDLHSNLFTLGTILYEMVVGRRAFTGSDASTLLAQIESEMPPSPASLSPGIHPALNALIVKALAKDPEARYGHASELLEDLEKCKENGNGKKGIADSKKPVPPASLGVDPTVRAAAATKFVAAGSPAPGPLPSSPTLQPKPAAAAASASANSAGRTNAGSNPNTSSADQLISDFEVTAPRSQAGPIAVSSVAAEREHKQAAPRVATDTMMGAPITSIPAKSGPLKTDPIKTDPMMSESAVSSAASGKSFSDLAEMPPLKEAVYVDPIPEPIEAPDTIVKIVPKKLEKPAIQPREAAQKAIKEISTVPPRLMLYSILGAVALILVVAVLIFLHVRSEDDASTATPRPIKSASNSRSASSQPESSAESQSRHVVPIPAPEPEPSLTVREVEKQAPKATRRRVATAAVPAVPLGDALIDSDPPGAQVQIDGKSETAWVTPLNATGLAAGKHIISASKTGYSSEIRALEVIGGSKSSLLLHLSATNAIMVVNSNPTGAAVTLDGKPTGRVTPAQFTVDKGSHTLMLRKQGYLDETTSAELAAGQNFQFAPSLKSLGNAEDIRTVGKFNKLFGRGGDSTAGMGAISVRTQPKGAQVVINQRVLDKTSPVEVMLGPGNYAVDITFTGFKPIHKVVTVEKGSKAAIDETLERQ